MAETIGSLCDKLTILELKHFHTEDIERLNNIKGQQQQLIAEIDEYISNAKNGVIPPEKLIFEANKVFAKKGNDVREFTASFGDTFAELAKINNDLWHEQEKVYEFEKVPDDEKNKVVKRLAILNLERNKCIDALNLSLFNSVQNGK